MKRHSSGEGMGEIVRTVARWLSGFILTYGIYIVLYGHLTPGGGFAGGVIIACGFILLTLAGGQRSGLSFLSKSAAATLGSAGVLIFLALAWVGMWPTGGAFLRNFVGASDETRFTLLHVGTISISDIGIGLAVAGLLFLVFTVLAAFRIHAKTGEQDEEHP